MMIYFGLLIISLSLSKAIEWNPYPFGEYPCTLNLYRAPAVKVGKMPGCYDTQNACIDWQFRYAMDFLDTWGQQCNVEVLVCRSFVRSSTSNGGSFNVRKNNEVGHGVDILLKDTSDGSLHSDWAAGNSNVDCFMRKLTSEPTVFCEINAPFQQNHHARKVIHVNDRRFELNHQYWVYLKNRLDTHCKFL